MAKNQRLAKQKRQQFQRYRGPFRAGADPSTIDPQYAKSVTKLKSFWAERVSTPGGVSKAEIPEDQLGYFAFRDHARHRPEHREDNSTPASLYHLATIFPGAKFISSQREDVLRNLREMRLDTTQPEHHFIIYRTRQTCLRLYFNNDKKLWWFVLQEGCVLRSSITYGSKDRAISVSRTATITWWKTRTFTVDRDSGLNSS